MVEPAGDQSQLGGRLTPRQERGEQKHGTQAKRDSSAARDLARARRLTRCVSRGRPARSVRPGPAAKSVGRTPSLLLQVLPHFSHTLRTRRPGAVLRARGSVWDGSGAALGGPPAAPRPRPGCKKCRQTPISTLTSFTPLFPTLRTRRPGAVLRARGSVWDGSGAARGASCCGSS